MASFYRREILKQAFSIIWRKKYLWFIGFFAGLVATGGEIDILFRNYNTSNKFQEYIIALRSLIKDGELSRYTHQLRLFFTDSTWSALAYTAILIILFCLFVWLIIVSQAALVRIVGNDQQKKNASFFDGLVVGTEKFWPLVSMNVIAKLITWGIWIVLAGLPAIIYFLGGRYGWAVTAGIGGIIVAIPISIIVSFLTKFSSAAIVIDNLSPILAIKKSWRLFKDNWLVSIELAVLVYLINLAISFGITAIALYAIQPYSVFTYCLLLFVLALELGILSSFSYSAWTITYLRLLQGRPESKLGHWTTQLVNFAGPKKIQS